MLKKHEEFNRGKDGKRGKEESHRRDRRGKNAEDAEQFGIAGRFDKMIVENVKKVYVTGGAIE